MDAGYPKEKYHVAGGSVTVRDKEHDKQFPYPDWQDQPFPPQEGLVVVDAVDLLKMEKLPVRRRKRIEEPIEAS